MRKAYKDIVYKVLIHLLLYQFLHSYKKTDTSNFLGECVALTVISQNRTHFNGQTEAKIIERIKEAIY